MLVVTCNGVVLRPAFCVDTIVVCCLTFCLVISLYKSVGKLLGERVVR